MNMVELRYGYHRRCTRRTSWRHQDEHDEDEIMKRIAEHTYIVSGNVEIEELNQKFEEVNIPEEPNEYDTVAGYIINHLGRIPRVNEEFIIEEFRFIISKVYL